MPYPPLGEDDESTMDGPHFLIKNVVDDASPSDEDIDHIKEILIDWNMGKINEDPKKK